MYCQIMRISPSLSSISNIPIRERLNVATFATFNTQTQLLLLCLTHKTLGFLYIIIFDKNIILSFHLIINSICAQKDISKTEHKASRGHYPIKTQRAEPTPRTILYWRIQIGHKSVFYLLFSVNIKLPRHRFGLSLAWGWQ